MNIEIERKGFEAWFYAAPHRAKYSKDHPAYLAAQEAWLARAEVEAGEAVLTQWRKVHPSGWPCKWNDVTGILTVDLLKDLAERNGETIEFRELFTTPQPSEFNAGIEALQPYLKHSDDCGKDIAGVAFVFLTDDQRCTCGLHKAILALRKGVV